MGGNKASAILLQKRSQDCNTAMCNIVINPTNFITNLEATASVQPVNPRKRLFEIIDALIRSNGDAHLIGY
jgi:hypothetical protein